jgi:DNA-binding CsgD family transcriptional regulator
MKSATLKKKAALERPTAPASDTEGLLRRLVSHVAADGTRTAGTSDDGAAVLLDMEVDGIRCRLMRSTPEPEGTALVLSPREREIARMVAKGYPNKTIAGVLEISSWTVSTYLRRIFAKLRVGSRAAMVARLRELGLLKS